MQCLRIFQKQNNWYVYVLNNWQKSVINNIVGIDSEFRLHLLFYRSDS